MTRRGGPGHAAERSSKKLLGVLVRLASLSEPKPSRHHLFSLKKNNKVHGLGNLWIFLFMPSVHLLFTSTLQPIGFATSLGGTWLHPKSLHLELRPHDFARRDWCKKAKDKRFSPAVNWHVIFLNEKKTKMTNLGHCSCNYLFFAKKRPNITIFFTILRLSLRLARTSGFLEAMAGDKRSVGHLWLSPSWHSKWLF